MEFDNKYDDIEKHFNQIMDEFAEERYENVNPMSELELHQQAIDDFQNIQKMSRGMKNGKATTPWGIPAEVWKIVLNPGRTFKKQRFGVGHAGNFPIPAKLWKYLMMMMKAQKRSKVPPMQGRFSMCHSIL